MTIVSLKAYATGLLAFAFFFWAWALKNTLDSDGPAFDLGLASFMTVMLSCTYVLVFVVAKNSSKGSASSPLPGKWTRYFMIASCIFVALNYMGGACIGFAVMEERTGFAIYCLFFTFLWFGLAWLGSHIMSVVETTPSEGTLSISTDELHTQRAEC